MKLKIQLAERNNFEPAKIEKTFGVRREEIDRLVNLVKKLLDENRPAKLNFSRFYLIKCFSSGDMGICNIFGYTIICLPQANH
jgi:hypothetical protein